MDKLDSHTVRFRFSSPNGLFPQQLASGHDSGGPANFPKHWLKRFHKRYNPQGLAAEITAAGAGDWVELFRLKSGDEHVPKSLAALFRHKMSGEDVPARIEPWPTLNAWMLIGVEDGAQPSIVAVRNPYYWKIDPGGQQLPYLDKVVYSIFKSQQEIIEFTKTGNIGMQSRRISHPKFYQELAVFQDQGGHRFFFANTGEFQRPGHRPQPYPSRPGQAGALWESGFPHRPLPGHRPESDHRARGNRQGDYKEGLTAAGYQP